MPNSTYFMQDCPTCGRRLNIRVEYLGKRVVCPHCRGPLIACDPNSIRYADLSSAEALLRRADELLRTVSQQSGQVRAVHPR